MSWLEIKRRIGELRAVRDAGGPMKEPWAAFVEAVRSTQDAPPYHLRGILAALKDAQGGRPAAEMVILDHGCSGGNTLLYLLALGYRGIYGVDIGGKDPQWNMLLQEEFGICEPRFFLYDGETLPLKDASVDFIFSQQVLEHVHPSVFERYYSEEGRVLKVGGAAFHQVPHRLVPYDSHTRTWLIHYFPPGTRERLYSLLGRDPRYVEGMLYLRMPSCHRTQLIKYIGTAKDVTLDRLVSLKELEYYDGPKMLRRMMGAVVRLPLIGRAIGQTLKWFVMLETVSVKTGLASQS